jgi:hypothetical protein
MPHKKLSVSAFLASLAAGRYTTGTAARRAIGRCSTWTNAERKQAHLEVDKKFGPSVMVTPPEPKVPKPRKKAAKSAKELQTVPPKHAAKAPPPSADVSPNMSLEEITKALQTANAFWAQRRTCHDIGAVILNDDTKDFSQYVQSLIELGRQVMNKNRIAVTSGG